MNKGKDKLKKKLAFSRGCGEEEQLHDPSCRGNRGDAGALPLGMGTAAASFISHDGPLLAPLTLYSPPMPRRARTPPLPHFFGAFSFPPRRGRPRPPLPASRSLLAEAPLGGPARLGPAPRPRPRAVPAPPPPPPLPGPAGGRRATREPGRARSSRAAAAPSPPSRPPASASSGLLRSGSPTAGSRSGLGKVGRDRPPISSEGAGMLLSKINSLAHLRTGTGGELHSAKLQPGKRTGPVLPGPVRCRGWTVGPRAER